MTIDDIEALFWKSCRLYPKEHSSFMFIYFQKLLEVAKAAKYLNDGPTNRTFLAIKHLKNKLADLEGPATANEVIPPFNGS